MKYVAIVGALLWTVFVMWIAALFISMVLSSKADAGPIPGDQLFTPKYCLDEGSARKLMGTIQYRGNAGYRDALQFGWVDCVDNRWQPSVRPIRATLLERRWKQRDKVGNVMILWRARSASGMVYIITRE